MLQVLPSPGTQEERAAARIGPRATRAPPRFSRPRRPPPTPPRARAARAAYFEPCLLLSLARGNLFGGSRLRRSILLRTRTTLLWIAALMQ